MAQGLPGQQKQDPILKNPTERGAGGVTQVIKWLK
jgi:hypothetical protein